MEWLEEQGRVASGSPVVLARNTLVLIGPAGSAPLEPDDIIARLAGNRLAMGQRDAVPAGSYARAWLRKAGLWDALQSQVAETDNVRAALALVARGETPLGIVYATDAQAEPSVEVVYHVPTDSHDAVLYPAAALTASGAAFLTYLTSPKAIQTFAKYGFGPAAQ
jgi:molybdate transport system substrate-binding protein